MDMKHDTFALRDEHKLRVYETKVFRKIVWPKKDAIGLSEQFTI
jgi:hypothetical protein